MHCTSSRVFGCRVVEQEQQFVQCVPRSKVIVFTAVGIGARCTKSKSLHDTAYDQVCFYAERDGTPIISEAIIEQVHLELVGCCNVQRQRQKKGEGSMCI